MDGTPIISTAALVQVGDHDKHAERLPLRQDCVEWWTLDVLQEGRAK